MKKIVLSIIALFFVVSNLNANIIDDNKGTKGFAFNNIGVGARYNALGGMGASIADDGFAMYWNAAAIVADRPQTNISFMHDLWIYDSYRDYVGLTHSFRRSGVGISVNYVNPGDIQGRTAPTDTYTIVKSYDAGVKLGYGFAIGDKVRLGFGAGYLRERISTKDYTAYVASVGYRIIDLFSGLMAIGGQVKDIGLYTNGDMPGIRFMTDAALYFLKGRRLKVLCGLEAGLDNYPEVKAGAEYAVSKSIRMQAGMRSLREGRGMLSMLNGGISFMLMNRISIDVAYKYGDITGNKLLGGSSNLMLSMNMRM